ncbi:MAG: rRNA maturation RNase YbeY [Alphaproteobacteria bacterium]|nr:rRNA maturation RNase YbeY [Alphaproteobacteria bacterium]
MSLPLANLLSVVVDLQCSAWNELVPDAQERCHSAAMAAFDTVGALSVGAEVSVVLANDAFIRSLNKSWRQQDKPTNVLAFPCEELGHSSDAMRLLGDIVIASGVVEREALDEDKDVGHHLAHMVVHGTLHLLGYDHIADDEATRMEAFETKALAVLGIDDPYATHPAKG